MHSLSLVFSALMLGTVVLLVVTYLSTLLYRTVQDRKDLDTTWDRARWGVILTLEILCTIGVGILLYGLAIAEFVGF